MDLKRKIAWVGVGLASLVSSYILPGIIATSTSNGDHRLPTYENLSSYQDYSLEDLTINGSTYRTLTNKKPARIVALAFGTNTASGSSNYRLAEAAIAAQRYYFEAPIYAQKEVSKILTSLAVKNIELVTIGEVWREYADTSEMFRRLKVLSNGASGDNLVIAHPAQMERARYMADYGGLETIPFLNSEPGWNKNDTQGWVTSPNCWSIREFAVRAIDAHRF